MVVAGMRGKRLIADTAGMVRARRLNRCATYIHGTVVSSGLKVGTSQVVTRPLVSSALIHGSMMLFL